MLARLNFDGPHMWHSRKPFPQHSRTRLAGQARRGGNPICPCRAFLACLAHHAPRSVALADCFSILSERIYLKMPLGKVTVPGWIARSLTGYRRVPIILLSSVSVLRQGVIACRLHLSSHRTSRKNVNMDSVSE